MLHDEVITSTLGKETIVLLPHKEVDGDSLGSVLALYFALMVLNKRVLIFAEEVPPEMLFFLPGIDKVVVYDQSFNSVDGIELAIAIDCGDLDRLGNRIEIFNQAEMTMNIDHHPTNTLFAKINYVDFSAAACAEIIYTILQRLQVSIDATIATCLYTAISSDTGGFRFANTSAITHRLASDLIEQGARSYEASVNLYENISLGRFKILSEIMNTLEMYKDGKFAFLSLNAKMLSKFDVFEEDIKGFSNMARSIRGVEVGIFLLEQSPNTIKVSMRSKGQFDLLPLVTKFGGGGHKRAAGFTHYGDLQELKMMILKELG